MKGKTRRKIRRFVGIPLAFIGAVFTIGSVIFAVLQSLLVGFITTFLKSLDEIIDPSSQIFPDWIGLISYCFIVFSILFLISWILCYIYLKSLSREINYFEEVKFGKPDENTIQKAVDGIVNAEKVKPFYVHAASRSKEEETVYIRLKEIGFAIISGGPGEGKSMVTYHTAYKFKEEDRYRVYRLRVELLGNKMEGGITDELLSQLDDLKGKRKLIIVDDAHKLAIKQDLNIILQEEAKEGHAKYVWIETEFYETEQKGDQLDTSTRIDFQDFFGNLLKDFYQSQNPILNKALEGHIEGLDDAIERVKNGTIRDAWHFAFVASKGEERLSQDIKNIRSDLKLLVLFNISAYTVLSGESELSSNYLLNKFEYLKFGWLTDALRSSSYSDEIRSLYEQTQDRKSMIRIYDKSESDIGYIASLHYNFARAVVRASLLRTSRVEDLLSSTRELLTSEYRKCIYIGVFHRDIRPYGAYFDSENESWLISFVNNLLVEWLQCYPPLLRGIKSSDKDIYNKIIRKLDLDGIAEKVSGAKAGQFQQIAYLLNALGDCRDELIEKLDLVELARITTSAEIKHFPQIEALSVALGDYREKLIEELVKQPDFSELAKGANASEVGQFQNLAFLLNALGDRRDELITELDLAVLAKATGTAEVGQFQQIAYLLDALGDRRDELITELDLAVLARAVGTAKVEQFEQLLKLLDALSEQKDQFIDQLVKDTKTLKGLAGTVSSASANNFQDIANLLYRMGTRKVNLTDLLNYESLAEKANEASPVDIRWLILFMARLDEDNLNKLIQEVDWASLCMMCPIEAGSLRALGGCLENLWKQSEIISDKSGFDKVVRYLQNHEGEIIEEIENAYEQVKMYPKSYASLYAGVGKFLWNCNQIDHELAHEIATKTMSKLIEYFWIAPINYHHAGQMINALYEIDPDSSNVFLKSNKVRGRIQQSINAHYWDQKIEGLKHLIEAFYRSAPDLWRKMTGLNWITVDLSSLDLDSIYRDVDEEKNIGTA